MNMTQEQRRLPIVFGVAVFLAAPPTLSMADSQSKADRKSEGHALLRAAREHREVLSSNFPGFRGKLRVRLDENEHSGALRFQPPTALEVKLENQEVRRSVEETLRSMIFHRMPPRRRNTSETKKSLELAPPDNHRLGRKVFLGDGYKSSYRIRDNQILEVDRQMGDTHLVITVMENQITPKGRHLPRHFLVTLFDGETGSLKSASAVKDDYLEMEGNFLPKRRQITRSRKGRTENLDILIEEIELLREVKLTRSTE